MHGLLGLTGFTALLVVSAVLFAEECGVPLPFLPGDVLLAGGGMVAASGHVSLTLFIAATTLAMCAGALIGHAWSHAAGRPALLRLAARVGRADQLERAAGRLRAGGWPAVLICRLLPGMRVYANLAAGVAAVRRRTFAAGLVPSVLIWTIGFTLLGFLIGRPVVRALGAARDALPVTLLIGVVSVVVLAVALGIPGRGRTVGRRGRLPRFTGAALLDAAVAGLMSAAVIEAVENLFRLGERTPLGFECLLAGGVITAYMALARWIGGGTAGETLLGVSYRRGTGAAP